MPQIDPLFDALMAAGGSDLHLSPAYPPMLRVRGELCPVAGQAPLQPGPLMALLTEILSPEQRATFARDNDLDFAYAFGIKARFRGNLLRKLGGVGAVFRVIPSEVLSAEQLGLPESIRRMAQARVGLVLVTGPTGSGKSTTLAAMLDSINRSRRGHILTVEDPVEFVHRAQLCQITHREVGRDTPSFADAIRSAGREDADVILVGELRGAETMRLALQAASSGVLVFATVHTNSAPTTIDRIINAFAAEQQPAIRGMLAECLTGIVAQQLLKRQDTPGRIACHEILVGNRATASIIREGKTMMLPSMIQAGRAEGMQSLDDTLVGLVRDKIIAAADALAKSADKENFAKHPLIAASLKGGAVH